MPGVPGDSVAAIIREDTIMNTSKGVRLVNDFTKSLNAIEDVSVNDTHISRNVLVSFKRLGKNHLRRNNVV